MPESDHSETTYPLRAAAKLTGLSPELLRAWERRYGVVEPIRTPGGTRRYRVSDLERLQLVKSAVDAGHRIGRVAHLDATELAKLGAETPSPSGDGLDAVLDALERLDAEEVQRLLSIQISMMGPVRFAKDFALPLAQQIGERWANGQMSVSSEHLATGVLRSLLGSSLVPTAASRLGPTIIFATPPDERHEIGLQAAALAATGAGARVIYLGAELPIDELLQAAKNTGAAVLALGLVVLQAEEARRLIRSVRDGLASDVALWVGGAGASEVETIEGVKRISCLDELEQQIALLGFGKPSKR
jgi:DNA-binding transcriptional MerR regulator/methylmalonyl-CoA mutase cobalamin-binding subunit